MLTSETNPNLNNSFILFFLFFTEYSIESVNLGICQLGDFLFVQAGNKTKCQSTFGVCVCVCVSCKTTINTLAQLIVAIMEIEIRKNEQIST